MTSSTKRVPFSLPLVGPTPPPPPLPTHHACGPLVQLLHEGTCIPGWVSLYFIISCTWQDVKPLEGPQQIYKLRKEPVEGYTTTLEAVARYDPHLARPPARPPPLFSPPPYGWCLYFSTFLKQSHLHDETSMAGPHKIISQELAYESLCQQNKAAPCMRNGLGRRTAAKQTGQRCWCASCFGPSELFAARKHRQASFELCNAGDTFE